jgi:uncharacterized protein (DUF427 family)
MSELAANGKPVESVWDYPRPPRVERVDWRIRVVHAGTLVVDAPEAWRVLETSQPPAYYVDPGYVTDGVLRPNPRQTFCEWKGVAGYADVVVPDPADPAGVVTVVDACWSYDVPSPGFEPIAGCWAFYAQRLDECSVDGEVVAPNEGSFYGGWITANVVGPFKGGPGTADW